MLNEIMATIGNMSEAGVKEDSDESMKNEIMYIDILK